MASDKNRRRERKTATTTTATTNHRARGRCAVGAAVDTQYSTTRMKHQYEMFAHVSQNEKKYRERTTTTA